MISEGGQAAAAVWVAHAYPSPKSLSCLGSGKGTRLTPIAQAASDHMIKNLQRENALIATAWYDLTSRLQSNHVVLQRRHDAPKSWLNKQRQLVNGQLRQRDMLYLY